MPRAPRPSWRLLIAIGVPIFLCPLLLSQASATAVNETITGETLPRFWVLLAALLVFLMQAGFKCLEVGFGGRRYEAGSAIMSLMNWLIVPVVFCGWGYWLMFGTPIVWGSHHEFRGFHLIPSFVEVTGIPQSLGLGIEYLLFQLAFAVTTASIVAGALAERATLPSYIAAALLTGVLVYPIFGHWAWNEHGWLKGLGFHDFAGSTVVHSVGGWIAWAGVRFVGPSRFDPRRPRGGQRDSAGYAVLGVFMLWFGWWGFNGGSSFKDENTIASIILNTNLAGACAGLAAGADAIRRQRNKHGDTSVLRMTLGGTLGGLVAISASCDVATPLWAMVIGATAGLVHNRAFERLPVWVDGVAGAIPVHLFCGVWGTFLTGVVMAHLRRADWWQFAVQLLGIGVAFAWAAGLSSAVFWALAKSLGSRAREPLPGESV